MKKIVSPIAKKFLGNFGYELVKTSLYPIQDTENILQVTLDSILYYHMHQVEDFFFIQSGAFDGVSFDPI